MTKLYFNIIIVDMLDRYLISGLEMDGKIIPIANFTKEGLLEEGDYVAIDLKLIVPARIGEEINLKTNKFEVASVTVFPEHLPEVILKPLQ